MSINSVGYCSRLDKQSNDLQPVVDQQAINNITVNADQYKDNIGWAVTKNQLSCL